MMMVPSLPQAEHSAGSEIVISSEVARESLENLRYSLDQKTQAADRDYSRMESQQARLKEQVSILSSVSSELRTDMERRNYQSLLGLARSKAFQAAVGDKIRSEFLARIQHLVILRERFRDIAHKLRLVEVCFCCFFFQV